MPKWAKWQKTSVRQRHRGAFGTRNRRPPSPLISQMISHHPHQSSSACAGLLAASAHFAGVIKQTPSLPLALFHRCDDGFILSRELYSQDADLREDP